jgi:hypothetical protein
MQYVRWMQTGTTQHIRYCQPTSVLASYTDTRVRQAIHPAQDGYDQK